MSEVRAWLERERARQREVTLDAALLGARGARYASSRIGLVAVRACARTVLHTLELWLLSREMPFEFLVPLFAMRALPGLLGGLHWGALESLRISVRTDVHAHRHERARASCEAWLSLSALVSLTTFFTTIAIVSRAERPEDGPNGLYGAFAIVTALSFGLELWSRTYHAGVFAVGRVYRPSWSIILPDTLELASIALLWSRLGPFSLHAGILLTSLVRFALSVLYTRRAFAARRMPAPRFFRLRALRRLSTRVWRDAATHAVMAGPFQLDRAFLLALLVAPVAEGQLALAAPYYALRPLIGLSQAWARPFFLDFVRIDVPGYGVLRAIFTRLLAKAGYVTAALSSLLVALGCAWSFGLEGLLVGAWLTPLALARARFSLDQVRAFAYAAHRRQIGIAFFLAAGIAAASLLQLSDRTLLVVLTLLLVVAQRAQRHVDSAAIAKRAKLVGRLPTSAWLGTLKREQGRVRISAAQVNLKTARAQAVLEAVCSARPSLRCTRIGRAWLVWWEPTAAAMKPPELAAIVGGTLNRIAHAEGGDGASALQAALHQHVLPNAFERALTYRAEIGDLSAHLSTLCPEALVLDIGAHAGKSLASRSSRELALCRRAIIAATREQHHVPSWAPWQAAVYAPGGEVKVAYLWPSRAANMADFRQCVLHATWRDSGPQLSGAPPHSDAGADPAPRRENSKANPHSSLTKRPCHATKRT